MDGYSLTLRSMLERAESLFPKKEVISRTGGQIFRYTYKDFAERTRLLSSALQALGVKRGDRVATFAWNDHRHLEAYFAIPCMGAVLHTVNIRLLDEHIIFILNHAEDTLLLVDESLLPIIERISSKLKTVKGYIVMTNQESLPATSLQPVYSYERLLAEGNAAYKFPEDIHESAPAGMCYTSATTGNPKGVTYTHRAIYLHSFCLGLADTLGLSERDTVMPIVPMFHVNAWGLPFASVWFGSRQVLPGTAPTPEILLNLIADEKVTISAGVPTVWTAALKVMEQKSFDLSHVRAFVCGGSAAPRSIIEKFEYQYGIPFYHAYGLTETSPVVTCARIKSDLENGSKEQLLDISSTQGLLVPGVEMKIIGANGEVAWDGKEMGELLLRGPWIAEEYYKDDRTEEAFQDGWLHTGDIAVVNAEGYMKLIDRTKDLVKSGGEWISSVDLENELMAHPAVFEACVVGIPHEKWGERPLACVVLKDLSQPAGKDELLQFLSERVVKWWVPDDVVFLPEIPKTSVGKFLKRSLREQFQRHYLDKGEVG
jgi:fatty-acyl-CoA synthase